MTRILATIFAALAGLAFGSFLNVCLSRWPEGESVVTPSSHCRSCGRALAWWENVPLMSWLALRGRCRTCKAWIGWRYPLVELVISLLWLFTAWRDNGFVPLLHSIGLMLLMWLLIALAILDAKHLWLPDFLTLPGAVLGYLWFFVQISIVSYGLRYPDGPWREAAERLLVILCAALLILLIRWLYKLIRKREGIGLGDAKLMAMLAAWLGLPGALLSFFLGVVIGSIVGIIALVQHPNRTNSESLMLQKLPLGTFLCIGGIVSALWGQPIIAAYLRWAGF